MILRPPRSTPTDTLLPDTTLCRTWRPIDQSRKEGAMNARIGRRSREVLALAGLAGVLAAPATSKGGVVDGVQTRSKEHTSELQSLMRISYAVLCLKKKKMT